MIVLILLTGEFLVAAGYFIVLIWQIFTRNANIQKARTMKDQFFDTKSRSIVEACSPIETVLKLYDGSENDLKDILVNEYLNQRITSCQNNLNKHGVIRKLRFVDVLAEQKKSGQIYRKWDHGGKEWRSCELGASALDEYISRSTGKVIHSAYYPSVQISFSMSRRLADDERRASTKKDKWGRKIVKDDSFYKDIILKNAPHAEVNCRKR